MTLPTVPTSDKEILNGLLLSDEGAQYSLLERYQDRCTHLLINRCPWLASQEIQDIVVDVLYQIIENPKSIDLDKGKGSFRGLITISAYRKAIDIRRKTKIKIAEPKDNESDLLENQADQTPQANYYRDFPSDGPSPAISQALNKMMTDLNLSEHDWEHLRLRLEAGLDPKEIAQKIKLTPENERVRWYRLVKKMRTCWVEYPALVNYAETLKSKDRKGTLSLVKNGNLRKEDARDQ